MNAMNNVTTEGGEDRKRVSMSYTSTAVAQPVNSNTPT